MSRNLRKAFIAQRFNAKRRGIEWKLTFDEWLQWWGEDVHRRGTRADQLQMQRFADAGPYALWNIRKGYPKQNAQTAAIVYRNRKVLDAAIAREKEMDRLMKEECGDKARELLDEDEMELKRMFGIRTLNW